MDSSQVDTVFVGLTTLAVSSTISIFLFRKTEKSRWDKDRLDTLLNARVSVQRTLGLAGVRDRAETEELDLEKDKAYYALERLAILFPGIESEIERLQKVLVERVAHSDRCRITGEGWEEFHHEDHPTKIEYKNLEEIILRHCQQKLRINKN